MRTGIANLPLHYGSAPRWLFERMRDLAGEISRVIVEEYGQEELLRRLSNPYWFQSFGCVLGFDWHSSGLSTTTCGALKEGLKKYQKDLGIYVVGGKGKTSRQTPREIEFLGDKLGIAQTPHLIYASKMSAKVDNTAVQDGFQLYHHSFVFTPQGDWTVIQQGMSPEIHQARRYHWLSENLTDFVDEPHSAICSNNKLKQVLDLTAKKSAKTRQINTELVRDGQTLFKDLKKINDIPLTLDMPKRHFIKTTDFASKRLIKTLHEASERNPQNFEQLLSTPGVGPQTIRAITLVSELIHSTKPSYTDPVRYSFAHGGKDGYPFPVDKTAYDNSIAILRKALNQARVERSEKLSALKRLSRLEI